MTTEQALPILAAFAAGIGLGALYLATLWLAVRYLFRLKYGPLLLVGSAWLRIGLLLAVWYWVSGGHWERLLACLAGFVVIRVAATRWASAGGAGRPAGS